MSLKTTCQNLANNYIKLAKDNFGSIKFLVEQLDSIVNPNIIPERRTSLTDMVRGI